MNIALSALVILALVLPGVLLSYTYRKGTWRSPVILGSIQSELTFGIFWAAVLHYFAITVLGWSGMVVDSEATLALLTGFQSQPSPDANLSSIYRLGFRPILLYAICINVAAIGSGLAGHGLVRRFHLDLRFPLLQFRNEWFYLFSAEARATNSVSSNTNSTDKSTLPEIRETLDASPDFVLVSAVMQQDSKAYVYSGILQDYYFKPDGGLKKIVLKGAHRRLLKDDKGSETDTDNLSSSMRFYPIDGDYLIVFMDDVQNLSVDYKWAVQVSAPEDEAIGASEKKAHRPHFKIKRRVERSWRNRPRINRTPMGE